jgi:hypothetical protein
MWWGRNPLVTVWNSSASSRVRTVSSHIVSGMTWSTSRGRWGPWSSVDPRDHDHLPGVGRVVNLRPLELLVTILCLCVRVCV